MLKFSRLVVISSPQSSRAAAYAKKVIGALQQFATAHDAELVELWIEDTPYLASVRMVRNYLQDGDLVVGACGDGINQVALQGAFTSGREVTLACLPLGNSNDFATALNGHVKDPTKILASPTIDFRPLKLLINHRTRFYVAAYATLGITTVAVDWLNATETRNARRRLAKLPPMAALRFGQLGGMSRAIDALRFPPFRRDCLVHHDDSVGFFLAPAAKGLLRPSGGGNFLTRDDFFFHFDNVRHKAPGHGWLGKSLVAGRWVTIGLPGLISDDEQLEFLRPADMEIHLGGETVRLEQVQTIGAARTARAIKILAARRSLQT